MNTSESGRIIDEEHLRLLRIGYLIGGWISIFVILFGLLYVIMGGFFFFVLSNTGHGPNGPPPPAVALICAMAGLAMAAFGALSATLKFLAARALLQRRSRVLCLVAAGLNCLSIPYGTAIGICTFSVLSRPSVRLLFTETPTQPPAAAPTASTPTGGATAGS